MRKSNFTHRFAVLPILITVVGMMLSACKSDPISESSKDSQLLVTVSILPQAYFVQRIGAEAVSVNTMVGPGEEPHTYEPKPEQMRVLSDSQLFFTIGTEYEEAWLPRFRDVNPELVFIDSAAGIQRIALADPHQHDDHPEDEEEHGLDPHVWLAPANGKIIAENILNALVTHAPEHAAEFRSNYAALIADIDALETSIQSTFANLEQRAFMVFHPAWGYFADQYNLEQIPVQVGGQEPSATEMANLITIAQSENIQVIFIQPTFSTANAAAIAQEINAEVVVVDPLARDWLANLELVAKAFAAALDN